MVSVDIRTRTAADVRPVDPVEFFEDELPELIADRADLALPGARELSPRPTAFAVDGHTWTLTLEDGQLRLRAGDDGAKTIVVLAAEGLADLVNDIRTPIGFFTGGDLQMPRGRLEDFLDWTVILRSLIDGRVLYTAGSIDFRDRDGAPLDLGRAYRPDDDPADMAHFLAEAGF